MMLCTKVCVSIKQQQYVGNRKLEKVKTLGRNHAVVLPLLFSKNEALIIE
jgi:hypothetical protein